jgi:hypothetical protein
VRGGQTQMKGGHVRQGQGVQVGQGVRTAGKGHAWVWGGCASLRRGAH